MSLRLPAFVSSVVTPSNRSTGISAASVFCCESANGSRWVIMPVSTNIVLANKTINRGKDNTIVILHHGLSMNTLPPSVETYTGSPVNAGSVLMDPAFKLTSAITAGSGTSVNPLATQLTDDMSGSVQRHPVAGQMLGSAITTR